MTRKLQDYIKESEAWISAPAVGDDFGINIREECLVESHIVDVTEDGVVLAADDKMIQILESYGMLDEALLRPDNPIAKGLRSVRKGASDAEVGMTSMVGSIGGAGGAAAGTALATGGGSTALFLPALGAGLVAGAALWLGGKLTIKALEWLARKVFGSKEQALEFAKAHLAAAEQGAKSFEWNGKTYPVKVTNPQQIEKLKSEIFDLKVYTQENSDPYRREVSPPSAEEFEESALGEQRVDSPVASAITRRILNQRHDLLQYGPEAVMAAIDQVAEWVGDVEEIGSSDISAWVKQVERMLRTQDGQGVAEGFPYDVDHMPGATIKNPNTGCKRCHGRGTVWKTADGKVVPGNEQGAKRYKCGACGGIGFVKQGVAEGFGDARYKIKVIGKDKNGDYYVSPNTGKKVYKKANRGDHESPSGILMAKIKEQDMAEAFMGYEIRRVPNLKISYEDSQELKRLISVITQRLARMPHSDPKDENNWRELVTAKNSILGILQKNGLQESDIRQPIDNMSRGVAEQTRVHHAKPGRYGGSDPVDTEPEGRSLSKTNTAKLDRLLGIKKFHGGVKPATDQDLEQLARIQELAGMSAKAPAITEGEIKRTIDNLYYDFNDKTDLPRDIDDDEYLAAVEKFLQSEGVDPDFIEDLGELFLDMRDHAEDNDHDYADQLDAEQYNDEDTMEAKYQGREVPLGKPMAGDVKKSKVYVRGPKGNVVKVNFGDKKMRIKKSNPKRRKSFRARHHCANPGPRWKARYWSCRAW
jgi:hypothetical protein